MNKSIIIEVANAWYLIGSIAALLILVFLIANLSFYAGCKRGRKEAENEIFYFENKPINE
jgi:hypothetical protein